VQRFIDFSALYFDTFPLEEADAKKDRVRDEGVRTLRDLDELEGESHDLTSGGATEKKFVSMDES
jgi:hypothetical protein